MEPLKITKAPSGSVLTSSGRPSGQSRYGIDLKSREVSLSPANFKDTVHTLCALLGKKEEEEGNCTQNQ